MKKKICVSCDPAHRGKPPSPVQPRNGNSLRELDPGKLGNLFHVRLFIRSAGDHAEKLFPVGSKDDGAGVNGGNAERLPQGLVRGDLFLRGVGIHEMLNIKADHRGTYCGGIFLGMKDRGLKLFAGGTPVRAGEQNEDRLVFLRSLRTGILQAKMPAGPGVRPRQDPPRIVGLRRGIGAAETGGPFMCMMAQL